METKNLGIVKAIFHQLTPPTRTDVLWYDTTNDILKIYSQVASKWLPVVLDQLSGALTDDAPTTGEINSITGLTPSTAGIGYRCTIKDTNGSELLYRIESNGTDWFFTKMTQAS